MSERKKHVAIYCRVSTTRQSHDSQEPDLDGWLAQHVEGRPTKWYRDKASGSTMKRRGWQRLEDAIDKGRISTVVVWRLDRLGRTVSGLSTLFEKLQQKDVELVSLRDGLTLSTPAGRLMANVLASVAAFENEVRSERVLAGQAVAKANGKRIGGGRAGRLCTMKREQAQQVVRLYEEGLTKAGIARATGLSRPWVYEVLRREGLHEPTSSSEALA